MITNIRIKESEKKLKELLSKETNKKARERIHAIYLIKTNQVLEAQELARIMAKNRTCITVWLNYYRKGGLKRLLNIKKPTGRKPKIHGEVLDKLIERLGSETGFNSIDEIKNWLKSEFELDCTYKEVHHTVNHKLGSKPKVVRPSNPKKDIIKVEEFKKNSQSVLKKHYWTLKKKK